MSALDKVKTADARHSNSLGGIAKITTNHPDLEAIEKVFTDAGLTNLSAGSKTKIREVYQENKKNLPTLTQEAEKQARDTVDQVINQYDTIIQDNE